MSFEKESIITLTACVVVSMIVCVILYVRWQDALEDVMLLKCELSKVRGK